VMSWQFADITITVGVACLIRLRKGHSLPARFKRDGQGADPLKDYAMGWLILFCVYCPCDRRSPGKENGM
jgi:hypothetical protein